MAKDIKAFLKTKRKNIGYRPVSDRVKDFKEVFSLPQDTHSLEQASRCMDCGTPFCHWACPIGNYIPEWNEAVINKKWDKAFRLLLQSNPFPEITGRVCPALCEYSCVLGINDDPVTVRENELAIIEYGFAKGYLKANPPKTRTGKKVAVIGSGPAGLAAAYRLNKLGHNVVVFEKDSKAGGILRYGIPDFKLDKNVLDRRIKILQDEGIEFRVDVEVGKNYKAEKLLEDFDAICLAVGSRAARDLNVEGRGLKGIFLAMDYLTQVNKKVSREASDVDIDAKGKKVVVIGGGDTGSDCVGTANRQGAKTVVQIEVMPKPSEQRTDEYPWPKYPLILKTSSSHEEGVERIWSVLTKKFLGESGVVKKIECVKVDMVKDEKTGSLKFKEIENSKFYLDADLVLIAVGFIHPEHDGLLDSLKVKYDSRGNVETNNKYQTSVSKVFAAGDMHRGQSLVVWAIYEGLNSADNIDKYLE